MEFMIKVDGRFIRLIPENVTRVQVFGIGSSPEVIVSADNRGGYRECPKGETPAPVAVTGNLWFTALDVTHAWDSLCSGGIRDTLRQ